MSDLCQQTRLAPLLSSSTDSAPATTLQLRDSGNTSFPARESRPSFARGPTQQAADAEDAALSAFANFWKPSDDFAVVLNRDDLWKLLGTITVPKALKQARREAAEKRGGGYTLCEAALNRPDGSPLPLDEAAGLFPAQEFDLHSAELLEALDPELRRIAVLRLLGHTNREIAGVLECTERKIERKLHLIRLQWEADWLGE